MRAVDENEWRTVQSLFEELIDLTPDEQTRRLTKSKHPEHIIQQAAALLTATRSQGILDMAAPSMELDAAKPTSYSSLDESQEVGGFTIERLIGRGGMGEVYLAHRTSADFTQLVALKLLRAEAADRGNAFMRERRLLARLEHPGIARLIDAGIAPDGRPYMAMEYIEGHSIDQYCRDQRCSLEQRLDLFRDVCDAVSYAHANLIIHRDIKPSNIMIDKSGKVRLLDFGIAKLLDDTSLVPATTQAMLTPDYAAPEQLDGDEPTVTADVYALGIVLYELICGKGPWRRDGASVPAIIRRVLYEDPAMPSKAAAEVGAPIPANRIAGDLDAIIMKAMRRNPTERYSSVADLATDVRRHQELKPVHARDGSTRYMVGRFVRRYRWAVAASTAAIAALLIGAGGIAWQARQTAVERDIAVAEAKRSEAINNMLGVMLSDSVSANDGKDVTVKQMLDQTSTRLVNTLDSSSKSGFLIAAVFDLHQSIEDLAGADALIQKALKRNIGKDDPVAFARLQLRAATIAASLDRIDEVGPLLDSAQTVFRTDPMRYRYELLDADLSRAQVLRRKGTPDQAYTLLLENLPIAERLFAGKPRELLAMYNNILVNMAEANRFDAMVPIFGRADKFIETTRLDSTPTALAIRQLKAVRLIKLKQPAAAEPILEEIVAKRRAAFGVSAGLGVDLMHLGRAKLLQGKFAEAERNLEDSHGLLQKFIGAASLPAFVSGSALIEAQAENGNAIEASRTIAGLEQLLPPAPPGFPHALLKRAKAVAFLKSGKLAQAKAEADQSEAIFKTLGPQAEPYLQSFPALRARIAKGS
jgi:serine/threonine protein kinase